VNFTQETIAHCYTRCEGSDEGGVKYGGGGDLVPIVLSGMVPSRPALPVPGLRNLLLPTCDWSRIACCFEFIGRITGTASKPSKPNTPLDVGNAETDVICR
jgi:hypothetical protein